MSRTKSYLMIFKKVLNKMKIYDIVNLTILNGVVSL